MNNCSLCQIPVKSPYRFNGNTYCPQCAELELPRLMRETRKEPKEEELDETDLMFLSDDDFYEEYKKEKQ